MTIAQVLQGRRVLIAHESAFQCSYLSEGVRAAGATVVGPVQVIADGIALLDCKPRVDAMVLSQALPHWDAVALVEAAISQDIRPVIVHPAQADLAHPFSDFSCLAMPYAAFQVVAALADVLAATRGCIHWSARTIDGSWA